ncbi:MAG: hypothetical protein ABIP68_02325, partial [Ferruginibacter sp.]
VEVICYIFRNWSYDINNKLIDEFKTNGVVFHCVEAGKEDFAGWLNSVFKEKIFKLFSKLFPLKKTALANSVSRRNVGLTKALNNISSADLVIGHNPGALWATFVAGTKFNCKMGFDVEDYHPGEGTDLHLQNLTRKLMQHVLPKMNYVSFASTLILEEIKNEVNSDYKNWVTILNYFPADEFSVPQIVITGTLKLVWFSQNINEGRGLELILDSLKSNPEKVELHLYGNPNAEFEKKYLSGQKNIFLHGTFPQGKLHKEIQKYDVGLALDIPTDKNRELAITNKILAYYQAGLYILASNTKSHKLFMQNNTEAGICFDYKKNFDEVLQSLILNVNSIREFRILNSEKVSENNWEKESQKLLETWKNTI